MPRVTFEFVWAPMCILVLATIRYSFRPRPSPTNSGKRQKIFESRYYGESYKLPQTQAIIEARVEALGENIVTMAKSMNSNIFNFLGPPQR
jgi:hypothetical protein